MKIEHFNFFFNHSKPFENMEIDQIQTFFVNSYENFGCSNKHRNGTPDDQTRQKNSKILHQNLN